jgi:hypothetical protein
LLAGQSGQFLSKQVGLSKLVADHFFALQRAKTRATLRKPGFLARFLSAPTKSRKGFKIHLESAVFVFHINRTTQGITGSLRAACSEPV